MRAGRKAEGLTTVYW